jgi:hypothetical protein
VQEVQTQVRDAYFRNVVVCMLLLVDDYSIVI